MNQNLVNTKQLLTPWTLTCFPKMDGWKTANRMGWPICRGYVVFFLRGSLFKGIFLSKSNLVPNFWSEVPRPQIQGRTQVEDGAVFSFTLIFCCWVKQEGIVCFCCFKTVKMCCFFLRFALRTDTVIYVILWNYISIWRTLRFDSICLVLIF